MKTILIFALSRFPWIGGIYYRRNIIRMMLTSDKIKQKYQIVVLVNKKYKNIFEVFGEQIKIVECADDMNPVSAAITAFSCCLKYKVRYVFPIKPYFFFKLFHITPVSWIADFQHNHYPDFFEQKEIDKRNHDFSFMANANNPLIVSSEDAYKDLCQYYVKERANTHVVHFTSYIDDAISEMNQLDENKVLDSFQLSANEYFVVSNQFWQHKNHLVVIEAVRYLLSQGENIHIAFTGELSDRRNPEYIDKLKAMLEDSDVADHIKVLGFVDRSAQLCVMKHAKAVIQPSLFEGWGTVVEDAKVLNKRMILSDISVHKEQMNENCVLFSASDAKDLAAKIVMVNKLPDEVKNIEDKTVEYAKQLENIFLS